MNKTTHWTIFVYIFNSVVVFLIKFILFEALSILYLPHTQSFSFTHIYQTYTLFSDHNFRIYLGWNGQYNCSCWIVYFWIQTKEKWRHHCLNIFFAIRKRKKLLNARLMIHLFSLVQNIILIKPRKKNNFVNNIWKSVITMQNWK